jgi:type IV pilus assembly protein PilA
MADLWYYVDRAQQRQGPVTAEAVAAAFRAGDADDASLVWREGLPEWQPLARFREELGLAGEAPRAVAPPAPPAPRPAPLPAPAAAAPARSGKGCLVIGLVLGGLVLLGVIGILAAVAVPQYRTYLARTNVALAIDEARRQQGLVDDFVVNTDRCPRDGAEIGLPDPASPWAAALTVGEVHHGMCTIELELGGASDAGDLAGARIVLARDSAGDWYCTSDIDEPGVLPADCD